MSYFHSRKRIVADVGRNTIRVGLTNDEGRLDHGSVREYVPSAESTICTAITAFTQDSGLRSLPSHAAIAVSGVSRGETIAITKSRWILSKSDLAAMFQAPPLIINDFAANAWAMSDDECSGRIEPMTTVPVRLDQPGTFCIIGLGSGLGVAIMSRDEQGSVTVLPTEGGHQGMMHGVNGAERIIEKVAAGDEAVTAETLFSGLGLLATYNAVCRLQGRTPLCCNLAELLIASTTRSDPAVAETFDFIGRGFWHFAGNIALAYGAWDGVILTGSIAAALKGVLRRPELASAFNVKGPWTRHLAAIPKATISFKHAELEGAAVAMLVYERRRQAAEHISLLAKVA